MADDSSPGAAVPGSCALPWGMGYCGPESPSSFPQKGLVQPRGGEGGVVPSVKTVVILLFSEFLSPRFDRVIVL